MKKDMAGSFAWAGAIVVLALAASLARRLGYIENETAQRVVIAMTGLMIAWEGNRMPKTFVPEAWARQARRVAAWSLVLSGMVHAGLWAFAPFLVAVVGGCGAVALGIAVTLGYCLSRRSRTNAA